MLAQNLRRHCRWLCRQRTPYAPTSAVLNAHFAVPCTTNGHQLIPAQHRTIINDLSSRRKAICNHIVASNDWQATAHPRKAATQPSWDSVTTPVGPASSTARPAL